MHQLAALTATAVLAMAPVRYVVDWPDCATVVYRVCTPQNVVGRTPGCYSDTGQILALWPCYVVINPDGTADVHAMN